MFEHGQKLSGVWWPDVDGDTDGWTVTPSRGYETNTGAESITVRLIDGPYCGLPWAEVIRLNGEKIMVNLALCREVFVLKEADK